MSISNCLESGCNSENPYCCGNGQCVASDADCLAALCIETGGAPSALCPNQCICVDNGDGTKSEDGECYSPSTSICCSGTSSFILCLSNESCCNNANDDPFCCTAGTACCGSLNPPNICCPSGTTCCVTDDYTTICCAGDCAPQSSDGTYNGCAS